MDSNRSLVARSPFGRVGTALLVWIPLLFLANFFAYPIVMITVKGLTPNGSFALGSVVAVLTDDTIRGIAAFTLIQAVVSTVITVVLALPAAWVFARFDFPGRSLLRAATLIPFVLPTLVVGMAFLALIGPRGALGIDLTGTMAAIVMAHVFYNFAIVVRGVGAYWERIDPALVDAARTLGASASGAFRTVTLPLLRPAIASTSALVFLFTFTSFGVVMLLGDLRHTTLEVEIWRQTTGFLRLDIASTIAVVQLLGVGVILGLYGRYQRRTTVRFAQNTIEPSRPETRPQKTAVFLVLAGTCLLLGTPLGVLIAQSLVEPDGGIGVANYVNVFDLPAQSATFVSPPTAIANSLKFAIGASVIGVLIGGMASAALAYSKQRVAKAFDLFVMLPLGTSAVTIGFGFLIALGKPVDIRASLMLIPIAHALVAIPFVVRTTAPSMGSVPHHLREAASTLGAKPRQAWWTIDVRLLWRPLLVGAAFAFAISLGEFGATSFISRPSSPTIPIAIFKLASRPGPTPFGAAIALSVILMVITAIAVFAIDSLRPRQEGDL